MAKDQELIVIMKTYDLILWSCNHTSRSPRNHRFVFGERIERKLYDLLEILIQAKYTRNRQTLLNQANLTLEILRFRIRLEGPAMPMARFHFNVAKVPALMAHLLPGNVGNEHPWRTNRRSFSLTRSSL
jgi:hypothetical protein